MTVTAAEKAATTSAERKQARRHYAPPLHDQPRKGTLRETRASHLPGSK